jgi:hypothetical protein
MRIARWLGVVSLSCTLVACATTLIGPELWEIHVERNVLAMPRSPVPPAMVRVFWFSPPDGAFDVLGAIRAGAHHSDCDGQYTASEHQDRTAIERKVRKVAGERGADVVWFQSETVWDDYCGTEDACMPNDFLEGVIGHRRE